MGQSILICFIDLVLGFVIISDTSEAGKGEVGIEEAGEDKEGGKEEAGKGGGKCKEEAGP